MYGSAPASTQAATLAARMTRLSRPPQLPPQAGQPQAVPQQLGPYGAPPPPAYGPMFNQPSPQLGAQGMLNPAGLGPHPLQGVIAQLLHNTRNPQRSNISALYQRFMQNQGVE